MKCQPPVLTSSKRFRHFIDGLLSLASFNLACRDHVPTFPQRSPPSLLTTAACGGLRPEPDCRSRRALLHLSYSCAPPFGPAMLVTHGTSRQLVRRSDMSGVGSKPDSSATVSIRRSGLTPTFMSDPFRASEWVASVRFHPLAAAPWRARKRRLNLGRAPSSNAPPDPSEGPANFSLLLERFLPPDGADADSRALSIGLLMSLRPGAALLRRDRGCRRCGRSRRRRRRRRPLQRALLHRNQERHAEGEHQRASQEHEIGRAHV